MSWRKTSFDLAVDTRDDGVKVFAAKCLRCSELIVGEISPPVPIIRVDLPPASVDLARKQVERAWDHSRRTGYPVVIPDRMVKVESMPDHSMERAILAHMDVCSVVLEVTDDEKEFAIHVASRTKHGPHGSGMEGPCDPWCVKCRAEQILKVVK